MRKLIEAAFRHVDMIGPHVLKGYFDLVGPGGTIILPEVWEDMIEPGMAIVMTMWPVDKFPGQTSSRQQGRPSQQPPLPKQSRHRQNAPMLQSSSATELAETLKAKRTPNRI